MNCCGAAGREFCVGCLGFWTFVFDLANSNRSVAGRSGSNRTPWEESKEVVHRDQVSAFSKAYRQFLFGRFGIEPTGERDESHRREILAVLVRDFQQTSFVALDVTGDNRFVRSTISCYLL